MITFRENGVPYIVCESPQGTTHRRAVAIATPGTALVGPATFPVIGPEVKLGERAEWTSRGWVIRAPKRRLSAGGSRG